MRTRGGSPCDEISPMRSATHSWISSPYMPSNPKIRKWPNRLGKFASAILLTIAGLCFHYNDRQARNARTATTGGLAVEAGRGCITGEPSIQVQCIPAHADARRADDGAAREAGVELFGGVWRWCCDARVHSKIRSGGSRPGGESGGWNGGRLRHRPTVRRADLAPRHVPRRVHVHALVCRSRGAGRFTARHCPGERRHLAVLTYFRFESGAAAAAAIATPRHVSARLPFHDHFR